MAVLGFRRLRRGVNRRGGDWAPAGLAVALGLACTGLASVAVAAQNVALEYAVKANYLYKLGPFVEWPPEVFGSASAPFNVCVLGQDPFGALLDEAVRGQTVAGHVVMVRRLQSVSKAPACHVLYIGRSSEQTRADVLQLLRGAPVLTVTDERLGGGGGLVHFVIRQGRVRFGVDVARAQASGLVISSKLLSLAVPVQGAGGS